MIVKVLVENTTSSKAYQSEHGLSLWVKTNHHDILFDMGASSLFKQNASALDVSIEAIDVAIISHGHYDHGGGLKTFLEVNPKAKVYIQEKAFEGHYSKRAEGEVRYIGLDRALKSHNQVVLVGSRYAIDEELTLFSEVKGNEYQSSANGHLLKEIGASKVLDDFSHEQNLLIKQGQQTLLIVGCAHRGIINILGHFHYELGYYPTHVIGGFHLYNHSANQSEAVDTVVAIGEYLSQLETKFYTCHCTGLEAYEVLRRQMGEQIQYIQVGDQVII